MALQILLFIPLIVFTQNYPSIFKGQGTTWVVHIKDLSSPNPPCPTCYPDTIESYLKIKQENDTIINSKIYHKIYSTVFWSNKPWMIRNSTCYMYQDTMGKVYSYYNSNDLITLDFDYKNIYQIKDTIPFTPFYVYDISVGADCPRISNAPQIVVDTIFYENEYKWIYWYSPWDYTTRLISGIGSESGPYLIWQSNSQSIILEKRCLKCMSFNDTIYYLNYGSYYDSNKPPSKCTVVGSFCCDKPAGVILKTPGTCDTLYNYLLNVSESKNNINLIKIYPTIIQDNNIKIDGLRKGKEYIIKVLGIDGRLIFEEEVISIENTRELTFFNIESGMYFIEIFENKEKKYIQKIIKL